MPQFKAFVKSAEKARSVQQALLIQAVALGAQSEGKDIKKAIDTLLNGRG